MKKSLFFAGLAAALSLVGCNKETDVKGLDGRHVEIVLSDVATRTVNYGMSTEWNAGDELSVFNAAAGTTSWSSNIKFTVQDASANRATGEVELTADAYDWYAFYPYTRAIPNPTTLNPEGSTYERSGYTTVGGQFQTQKMDDNMEHLAGVKVPVFGNVKNVPADETPVIEMKNAASVVRFKVVNDLDEAIKVLSVKFTAPEDIVGTYYIDFSGTTPAFVGSGDTYVFDNVMVTNADPSGISPDSNAEYYAVIKPFTAAAGAKLKVEVEAENADGTKKGTATKEITLAAATEFKPGYIKLLNIPFDATMTTVTAQEIPYEQAFADGAGDFTIDNVIGSGIWTPATASGQNCMKGTSYLSGKNTEGESWLVSPEIDGATATNGVKLSFKQCINTFFGNVAEEATLWAREKGGEWKQFTITYPTLNGTWSDFEEQVVDLSEFKGKTFQFAFKYVGHTATAGTWEICNVAVTDEVVTYTFLAELQGESTVPANVTSVTIKVTGNVAWTAVPSDGVTLDKESGVGNAIITASFAANTDPVVKNYSVRVGTENTEVEDDELEITFSQAAASTEAKEYPFNESFATDQGDFTIENVSLGDGLSNVWSQAKYKSDTYMKASAYVSGKNIASESWLISPVVDMARATAPVLSFRHCVSKFFGDVSQEATVWIKEEGGSWNQLTVTYPTVTSGNFSSFEGVSVDVAAYAGKKVQVGFKYVSTSDHAGTWEVTDFKLDEAVTGPVDPTFTAPETLSVEVGKTAKINVTTNSDGAVTFATSDAAVATVAEDGTVTGVAAGTANVTVSAAATANFNAASATVAVTVTEVDNTLHTIVVADYASTSFTAGVYSFTAAQDEAATPPAYNANGRDLRIYAKGTLTVSNSKENMTKIVFNLSTQGLKRLAPITASTGTIATQAENDTKVTWTGDASSVVFTVGDKAIFGSDGDAANGQLCFTTVDVSPWSDGDVQPKTLSSIEVSGQKTTFTVGDEFVFGGTVTAVYSDGSRSTVDESDVTISGYDMSTAGEQTVSVTYQTKSTEYVITVNAKPDVSGESWAAVPTLSDLAAGTYVITALSSDKYYAVPSTTINGQTFTCVEGIYNSTDKTFSPAEGSGEFVLTAGPVENSYYIYNPTLEKYLVATGSKKFGYVDNTSSDYGYWTFSEVTSGGFSGVFSVKHDNKSHYMRAYNNTVRCYDGTNNSGVYFFKK